MKESQQIRFILYCFRAFGFYPLDIQSDSLKSLHLKINTIWYIYATIVTLINFVNVVEVTIKPNWDISSFHGLISYTRLIMVSLDSLICYMETLQNIHLHVQFFEIIAQLDAVFRKFKIRASFKRLWLWVPISILLLSTLNVIPQSVYIYGLYYEKPIRNSLITLQFEIPNLLASVKSLQICFYGILILGYFQSLENVQKSYNFVGNNLTFNEFNHYHNQLNNLIDLFNKCFGWSILVNVTRDFVFFGEGSYLLLFSVNSWTQIMLLTLMWGHIVYCILLCGICQHVHVQAAKLRAIGSLIERTKCELSRKPSVPNANFSLKILHNVATFNAVGCFVIDLNLLYSFLAFLTSYLLICIQFSLATEDNIFSGVKNKY